MQHLIDQYMPYKPRLNIAARFGRNAGAEYALVDCAPNGADVEKLCIVLCVDDVLVEIIIFIDKYYVLVEGLNVYVLKKLRSWCLCSVFLFLLCVYFPTQEISAHTENQYVHNCLSYGTFVVYNDHKKDDLSISQPCFTGWLDLLRFWGRHHK